MTKLPSMWALQKVSTGLINIHTLRTRKSEAMLGFNYHCRLGNLKPVKVVVITQEEYERLKSQQRLGAPHGGKHE